MDITEEVLHLLVCSHDVADLCLNDCPVYIASI